MGGPLATVVILAWNDSQKARRAVNTLLATSTIDVEVLVVDNGSDEPYRGELAEAFPEPASRVRLIRSEKNLGYGAGMNLGGRAANGDVLIFANNDLEFAADVPRMLCGSVVSPGVGVAFADVRDPSGHAAWNPAFFPTPWRAAGRLIGLDVLSPRFRLTANHDPGAADWYGGACFAVRRETYKRLGGLSERSFMYAEELRLCRQLHQLGLAATVAKGALVLHEDDASARKRWTSAEIAYRQTHAFLLACADLWPRSHLLTRAGFLWRSHLRLALSRDDRTRAVARACREARRSCA